MSRFLILVIATCFLWMVGLRIVWNWALPIAFGREMPRGFGTSWPVWLRVPVVLLMIASVVCLGWAFMEPYFPVTTSIEIRSSKIRQPIRIVQVSDFHSDPKTRAENKVVELVREAKPDLIVFTGDGVNSDEGIAIFKKTMNALSKIAPVYGVRGNWEVWWFTHLDSFKETGILELNGKGVPIEIRGQTIWLGGANVDSEFLIDDATDLMPKDAYRIFLHHYPAAESRLQGQVDLLLSGDTHGGQIVFPGLGPLIRITRWNDTFYDSGLHQIGNLQLYVNRGIGMEGHNVPRTRFMCPPEVTVIDLLPDK